MGPCEQWEEALSAFLDGELDETARRAVTEHLAECPACREYLADLTAIGETMETVPAPEGFARSVMDRVGHTPQAGSRKVIHWRRWGALAACCALVLLGAWRLQAWEGAVSRDALPASAFRSAAPAGGDDVFEDAAEEEAALPAPQSEEPAEACGYTEKSAPAADEAQEPEEERAAEEAVLFGLPGVSVVIHSPEEAFSPGADCESVLYEGETFLLRSEEDGLTVFWSPQGEAGPCCEAQAPPETAQNEIFDILLSLDIS